MSHITLTDVLQLISGVVTVASVFANFTSPTTRIGKALHVLALNGPRIQAGLKAAEGAGDEG